MIILFGFTVIQLINSLISILTPIVLVIWFIYSQKQYLSNSYLKEINGIYGGYCEPVKNAKNEAGIIMNIRDTDNKGYFKGELQFKEIKRELVNDNVVEKEMVSGIHSFFGKLNHKIFFNKKRNPFKVKTNRLYKGSFYIVDRLDFNFEKNELNDYLVFEYDILHFREMQILKFTFKKQYRNKGKDLPKTFKLHKSLGLDFEPYMNVKKSVFNYRLLVDKKNDT